MLSTKRKSENKRRHHAMSSGSRFEAFRRKDEVLERTIALKINDDYSIASIKINRSKELGGLTGNQKGDHTTSAALNNRAFNNNLIGIDLRQAHKYLMFMFNQYQNFPGVKLVSKAPERLALAYLTAEEQFMSDLAELELQSDGFNTDELIETFNRAAQSLSDVRNTIPGSAFEFGGTGGTEGPPLKRLDELEEKLRLDDVEFEKDDLTSIAEDIATLLDIGRINDEIESFNDSQENFSSQNTNVLVTDDVKQSRQNFIETHVLSISVSYPLVWNAIKSQIDLVGFMHDAFDIGGEFGDDFQPVSDDDEDID